MAVPQAVLDAMRAIVDYDWETEQRDYEQEGKPDGHVFTHLTLVDEWLTNNSSPILNSTFDFVSVEHDEELTIWNADGGRSVIWVKPKYGNSNELETAAQKIRDALGTYEGWVNE